MIMFLKTHEFWVAERELPSKGKLQMQSMPISDADDLVFYVPFNII